MKKLMLIMAFLSIGIGSTAYAEGIAVKDIKGYELSAAEYSEYLDAYSDTQVTDIVIPADTDSTILEVAKGKAPQMNMNLWISYKIETPEDLKEVTTVSGSCVELDFEISSSEYKKGGISLVRKTITEKLRELKNNGVKVSAAVWRDMDIAYSCGLDIYTWSDEELINEITIKTGSNTADNDIGVDFWKSIISENIRINVSVGLNQNTQTTSSRKATLENAAAMANIYLSDGADKIYFDDFGYEEDSITFEPMWEGNVFSKDAFNFLVRNCGSIETLSDMNKRFFVANSEMSVATDASYEYNPLPLTGQYYKWNALRIKTGQISSTDKAVLLVGFTGTSGTTPAANNIEVCLNHTMLSSSFEADGIYLDASLYEGKVFAYDVDTEKLDSNEQILEIRSISDEISVNYIELRVMNESDKFIFLNMSDGTQTDSGRNVITAAKGDTLSYSVTVPQAGIYGFSLCYKTEKDTGIILNGEKYTLKAHSDYETYGFASLRLNQGENIINISAEDEVSFNYLVLSKADLAAYNNDVEIEKLQNGNYVVKGSISGLLKGQNLSLVAAVYEGERLLNVTFKDYEVNTDNYSFEMPVNVTGISDGKLKLFLWNNMFDIIPYADCRVY